MSQEQIMNEWLSELQQNFQEVMPPIDKPYPEVFFVDNENSLQSVIKTIDDKIHLTQTEFNITSFIRYLHGDSGDAMLIIVDRVSNSKEDFAKQYYFELAVFYVTKTESQEWYELYGDYDDYSIFSDEDLLDELENRVQDYAAKFAGYHLCITFFASSISYKISHDIIQFERDIFEPLKEHERGLYFAWAIHNRDKIVNLPDELQSIIDEFTDILNEQLKKEQFWVIDEDMLIKIGELFCDFDWCRAAYLYEIRMTKEAAERRKIRNNLQKIHKAKRKSQKQARKKNRRK